MADENLGDDLLQKNAVLSAYYAARHKIDEAVADKTKLAGDALTCGQGCAQCCAPELTVLPVEAAAIELHLEEEGLGSIPAFRGDACPFLDADDACTIYEARPVVCRTQGLALRVDDADEEGLVRFSTTGGKVAACKLNYTERDPGEDEVLDLASMQALLTAVNSKFCMDTGYPDEVRVPLAALAEQVLGALVEQGIVEIVEDDAD